MTDAWRVPARVEADGDVVTVARAWPGKDGDGVVRVTIEGRDRRGRLRAGTVERGGRVRLLPSGTDPKLPALERLAADGELVVHRAGRRAVLRREDGFTKVVRTGRSAAVDLIEGHDALSRAAEGYAAVTGTRPAAPGPWVAAVLLARVVEPWRRQVPGWSGETVRRALLAGRVLETADVWSAGDVWSGQDTTCELVGAR